MSLTADEAIARARLIADEKGWPFLDEIRAESFKLWWVGPKRWRVITHCDHLGGNVRVEINDSTGDVVTASFLPR